MSLVRVFVNYINKMDLFETIQIDELEYLGHYDRLWAA